MSLRKINESITSKQIKMRWSVENTLLNRDSGLFCDECSKRLGLFRMLRFSLTKKEGVKYYVVCPECRFVNVRVKGEIGKKIDSDWGKHGV